MEGANGFSFFGETKQGTGTVSAPAFYQGGQQALDTSDLAANGGNVVQDTDDVLSLSGNASYKQAKFSINDDAAASLPMPTSDPCTVLVSLNEGTMFLHVRSTSGNAGAWLITSGGPSTGTFAVTQTVGTLSGTTGTDGDFTARVDGSSNLWLENRLGGARSGAVHFLGN